MELVSVTIPVRVFNAFFMQYTLSVVLKHLFSISDVSILFAFKVQWLLRFSIFC